MKYLALLIAILIGYTVSAQSSGQITYVQTVSIDIDVPEGMEEMFKNIPRSRTSKKILEFNEGESYYRNISGEDAEFEETMEDENREMVVKMRFEEPDNKVYLNFDDKKMIQQQVFLGKTFLISDDVKDMDWKVTSERRQILDHVCMKATTMRDTVEIAAWFTPQIRKSIGPQTFHGLPGAILMVDIDNGQTTLIAQKIDLESEVGPFEIPSKGKKVSYDEFKKIQDERLKEMGAHGSGNVRMVIRG